MKKFEFTISGNNYSVEIRKFEDNLAEVEVNGTRYQVEVHSNKPVSKTPRLIRKPVDSNGKGSLPANAPTGLHKIQAPLPGLILEVNVKPGDTVKLNQRLLVMEAMKMENNIQSDKAGTIKSILVNAGSNVLQGDILIEMEVEQ